MCGLAGVARRDDRGVSPALLRRMVGAIRHRGPDGFGLFSGARCGLAHVRLSIIDVAGGAQPLGNEDGRVLIVYNGEVYNYLELREELRAAGHRFRTRSDTEVLVHAYEQWSAGMLDRLNGQFAFVIYDRRTASLFMARDRFGICPLFYAVSDGDLYFASEAKALFASGNVDCAPDLHGIDEVLTFWGARAPRTVFRGVSALEPGCFAIWRDGELRVQRYYRLDYPEERVEPREAIRQLDDFMRSSVALRMRADVPVGGYLSGGLDSSITCALATQVTPHDLRTFSVTFDDPRLDESNFQRLVAQSLGSQHHVQAIDRNAIARVFPDVIHHAETPVLRTAPAPLFLLSRLTRENGIKVVLTGEGSDELFLGYDLFKEVAVRLFCLRRPESTVRPKLLDRLYPYLNTNGRFGGAGGEMWRQFFLRAGPPSDPLFSHLPRFQLASWAANFLSSDVRAELAHSDAVQRLRDVLPAEFTAWSPLNRAAYLEMTTLLSSYLLCSQGERMAMAHGVEGRFPFLDHRLFEFAASLPTSSKLLGLREKEILRRWADDLIPALVRERPKQPYRAPDIPAFFDAARPEYVDALLDPSALREANLFDPSAVTRLVARCRSARATSARESQALVAIVSAQLWHNQFLKPQMSTSDRRRPDVEMHDDTQSELNPSLLVTAQ